jgi:predicted ATPase/DNA-binding XRE family transcriptional regulator
VVAFADLLAELRLGRGLSQEELAAAAKVSVRAISDLERGLTRRPQAGTVRRLADTLELSAAERAEFERASRQAPPTQRGRLEPAAAAGLPAPLASIVGRDTDIAAIGRLLQRSARLVTITGPGGVGKTRLAVEAGWRTGGKFDRVGWVDLSPLRAGDEVPAAIAAAIGPTGQPGSVRSLIGRIGSTSWLLVLDSAERVADAAHGLADLLAGCPRLVLLVTSRVGLQLRGEHLWPLAPLAVPPTRDPGEQDRFDQPDRPGGPAVLDRLAATPAVALLVERARAVRPGFAVDAGNAAAVTGLCRRLDGLPLAIELAAARLRTQEPQDLVALLGERRAGLHSDAADLPDRHRSLPAAVAWSTDQLAPAERLVLGALALFPGGTRPPALRAVLTAAGAVEPSTVDGSVAALAACSLVTVADRSGAAWIGMLDTIREIAVELLADAAAGPAVRRAFAEHAAELLTTATGSDPDHRRVDAELPAVRAGLAEAVASAPELLDPALVRALTAYHTSRGHFPAARHTLSAIAKAAPDPAARAYALLGAGIAANEDGDQQAAVELGERAAAHFAELPGHAGRCAALTLVGNAHKLAGQYPPARTAYTTALTLAEAAGDRARVAVVLNNLGILAHELGEYPLARGRYTESLRIKRELGDEPGAAVTLISLTDLDRVDGRLAAAREAGEQAASIFRAHGERRSLAHSLAVLAGVAIAQHRPDDAAALAGEALEIARTVEYRPAIGLALARLGDLAAAAGDRARAVQRYRDALDHLYDAEVTTGVLHALAALETAEPAGD